MIILITTLIGLILGFIAIKIIATIDGCFLIQKCCGINCISLCMVKTQKDVKKILEQDISNDCLGLINSQHQIIYNYIVTSTFGWLQYKKKKEVPKEIIYRWL